MLDDVYTKSQSIMYIGDKEKCQYGLCFGIYQAKPDL